MPSQFPRRFRLELCALALGAAVVAVVSLRAAADPPAPAAPAAPPAAAAPAPAPTLAPAAPAATVTETPISEQASTVSIVITVVPARRATVNWGKKSLGVIAPKGALVVTRPRDSGPLDLIIKADGCMPVHTRAYTFSDSQLAVRVMSPEQKSTLLGYKQEVVPDAGAGAVLAPTAELPASTPL